MNWPYSNHVSFSFISNLPLFIHHEQKHTGPVGCLTTTVDIQSIILQLTWQTDYLYYNIGEILLIFYLFILHNP